MERRLFEALVPSGAADRKRRAGFLPLSLGLHLTALGAILVGPVLSTDLPTPTTGIDVMTVPATFVVPPPPRRGVAPRTPERPARAATTSVAPGVFAVPTSWSDVPRPDDLGQGGTDLPECEGCVPWGVDDVPTQDAPAALPAPPPPVVRVGRGITPPLKLLDVAPVYPDLARTAGVQGLVIIECRIGPDGHVADARVLRGHPLLDAAALDAVRQWRYRATLLNGEPVSVLMTVTVRFVLRR
jgi:protein TonB